MKKIIFILVCVLACVSSAFAQENVEDIKTHEIPLGIKANSLNHGDWATVLLLDDGKWLVEYAFTSLLLSADGQSYEIIKQRPTNFATLEDQLEREEKEWALPSEDMNKKFKYSFKETKEQTILVITVKKA